MLKGKTKKNGLNLWKYQINCIMSNSGKDMDLNQNYIKSHHGNYETRNRSLIFIEELVSETNADNNNYLLALRDFVCLMGVAFYDVVLKTIENRYFDKNTFSIPIIHTKNVWEQRDYLNTNRDDFYLDSYYFIDPVNEHYLYFNYKRNTFLPGKILTYKMDEINPDESAADKILDKMNLYKEIE